jgi:hypothetical protein
MLLGEKRREEHKRFGTIMRIPHFDQPQPLTIAPARGPLGGNDLRKRPEIGGIIRIPGMLRQMGSGRSQS